MFVAGFGPTVVAPTGVAPTGVGPTGFGPTGVVPSGSSRSSPMASPTSLKKGSEHHPSSSAASHSPSTHTVSSPKTPVSSSKSPKVARRVFTPGSFCFVDQVDEMAEEFNNSEERPVEIKDTEERPVEITDTEERPVDIIPEVEKGNQHTEPNWLLELTSKFSEKIIDECSGRTKAAVKNNEAVQVCIINERIRFLLCWRKNVIPYFNVLFVRVCKTIEPSRMRSSTPLLLI